MASDASADFELSRLALTSVTRGGGADGAVAGICRSDNARGGHPGAGDLPSINCIGPDFQYRFAIRVEAGDPPAGTAGPARLFSSSAGPSARHSPRPSRQRTLSPAH